MDSWKDEDFDFDMTSLLGLGDIQGDVGGAGNEIHRSVGQNTLGCGRGERHQCNPELWLLFTLLTAELRRGWFWALGET